MRSVHANNFLDRYFNGYTITIELAYIVLNERGIRDGLICSFDMREPIELIEKIRCYHENKLVGNLGPFYFENLADLIFVSPWVNLHN